MLFARIRGTRAELRALADSPIFIHRRAARKISDDLFEVPAVLDQTEATLLELKGYTVIAKGDTKELLARRLSADALRPASFSSRDDLFHSVALNDAYMTTDYIERWTVNLAELFPAFCTSYTPPYRTWEGRSTPAVRLGAGAAGQRTAVLFTSGVHAGELGGPDSCIYFLYRLMDAWSQKKSIVLGAKSFSAGRVEHIMEELDIYVLPCVNPDGRAYVETAQEWWRKNRNPEVGMGAIGVDINRNFDFLWSTGIGSSILPMDHHYRGAEAFSEPETRNMQWLMEESGAAFFVDIHGPAEMLVHPWGDAETQSTDPGMSFLNPLWDGKRSQPYKEYMALQDAGFFGQLGNRVVGAVNAVRQGRYPSRQGYEGLYPTTATSDDYAYSRHMISPNAARTYAYTFEYGGEDDYPPYDEMQAVIDETNAGMLELCDAVAGSAT